MSFSRYSNLSNLTNNDKTSHEIGCYMSPDFDQTNVSDVPASVRQTWTVLLVINSLAIPSTSLINALIIWTILKTDKTQTRASFNVLLAVLATTDLLVGCIVLPLFVAWLSCVLEQCAHVCVFSSLYGIAVTECCTLTLCAVMMICLERYLSIVHPFFYTSKVTLKKLLAVTGIVLVCMPTALTVTRSLADGHTYRKVPSIIVTILSVIVIIFCTIRVHMAASRHKKAIGLQNVQTNKSGESTEQEERNIHHKLREYKRAFTVTMVVVASSIFYLPMMISFIIEAVFGKHLTVDFKYVALPIYLTFVHLQSIVNPVIISLRFSYIREGVMQKLCKCS